VLRTLRANPAERFPDLKSLEKALFEQVKVLNPGSASVLNQLQGFVARLRPGARRS
jgi:hypothetical protein